MVTGAGDVGLEKIAAGAADEDGDLAAAAGGFGFLVFDDGELGLDQGDEGGVITPGGGGDGGFALKGEFSKDEEAGVRESGSPGGGRAGLFPSRRW